MTERLIIVLSILVGMPAGVWAAAAVFHAVGANIRTDWYYFPMVVTSICIAGVVMTASALLLAALSFICTRTS